MKIAYVSAGAGGMYCGSCMHDNTLAAALQKKGHQVALIPTYTPMRTDETNVSINKIFYGGLNVFLQEKFSFFRHTPWIFDKLLNRPGLLNWLSRFSSTTNAQDLGALTVSVLKGEDGNLKKELNKLVKWLREDYKPDLVQLTNSMFLGFAREIKNQLQVPVICAVQGEDLFLEDLIEPYKSRARSLLIEKTKDIDAIIAPCNYYADFMANYLQMDRQKAHIVNLGINLAGHGNGIIDYKAESFVIGYLARICPEKGLHLLVDAFYKLWQTFGPEKIHLKIAGYISKKDEPYFENIKNQIDSWGLNENFEYVGELDRLSKIIFLNSLHVLSVPTTYKESKGLFVFEALANGVPVVQPKHGSFPEIIEATGGGLLFDPHSTEALADGIQQLLNDAELREKLGSKGKKAVHQIFHDEAMADATLKVYEQYL